MSCQREAPRQVRMASSRSRVTARACRRLAAFATAITSTSRPSALSTATIFGV